LISAVDFASTPAGYITGIGLPVASFAVGWVLKQLLAKFGSVDAKLDEHAAAMAEQSRALAVLVTQVAPMQIDISESKSAIQTMRETTAVLKSRMDQHEAWAAKEHERILRQVN